MITCVNYENLQSCGGLLHAQFALRYREFIERQDYEVRTFRGMEYDQYDSPAASYLIYDEGGNVLGASRLTPTTQGCMLADLWPGLVENKANLCSERIWEGTRYCIDKRVPPALRRRIVNEMAIAYLEFGLLAGLQKIIGMMPTYIYYSVFEKPGIEMEYLGGIRMIGRHKIRAVAIPVSEKQLEEVRRKTGIYDQVLNIPDRAKERDIVDEQAA
jgi:N-acyl-L-homoserine lactone synthetase